MNPFYIEPTGYVNTFAIRFYPYGFANFITVPIKDLANKETPISSLFGEEASRCLEQEIIQASDAEKRIEIVENFFLSRMEERSSVENIVKSTIDTLLSTKGSALINFFLKGDLARRRQLERKFVKLIGVSPGQPGRVIRLQAALNMLLNGEADTLTRIAYESEYQDQAHSIKDFKEFTGVNPKEFLGDESMALASLFYK